MARADRRAPLQLGGDCEVEWRSVWPLLTLEFGGLVDRLAPPETFGACTSASRLICDSFVIIAIQKGEIRKISGTTNSMKRG